jgi:hypothetical protein
MLLATVFTAGSMTQSFAPVFITVAEARLMTPANIDVTITISRTAKVMPTSKATNLPRSLTRSFVGNTKDSIHEWRDAGGTCGMLRDSRLPAHTPLPHCGRYKCGFGYLR